MKIRPVFILLFVLLFVCMARPSYAQNILTSGDYQYTLDGSKALIVRYTGSEPETLFLPEQLDGNAVISIGPDAFSDCIFTSISVPAGVTSIAQGVFSSCLSLLFFEVAPENPVYAVVEGVLFDKELMLLHTYPNALMEQSFQIPEGTLAIGKLAFSSCANLASVQIPPSVQSIGEAAFLRCLNLESLVIPEGVSKLESGTFAGCERLMSIQIPQSVTDIGAQAFHNCGNLRQIILPYGLTAISPYAFAYCQSIWSVVIPDGVTNIGDGAFMGCDFLSSVSMPGMLESVGSYAFGECTGLQSLRLSQSVISIGDNAFYACSDLMVYVAENSYAHKYCESNGISYSLY